MWQTKVVKASTAKVFEDNLNLELASLGKSEIVDIKLTGASDGSNEFFLAVIVYKK